MPTKTTTWFPINPHFQRSSPGLGIAVGFEFQGATKGKSSNPGKAATMVSKKNEDQPVALAQVPAGAERTSLLIAIKLENKAN